MRSANKTVYIEPTYSQTRNQFQPYYPQSSQQSPLVQSRQNIDVESQKTEQSKKKYLSPNAINIINQMLYEIVNMDPKSAQTHLRKSAKTVYDLIDNELLLNIKNLSNMKLLMYNTILMYIEQFSQGQKDKHESKLRQKAISNSLSKNVSIVKQQSVALQTLMKNQQLQNLKQTTPFIPRDKPKLNKTLKTQQLQDELTAKIQSTRQSLQNILKKIQHYGNYKLTGEDIMRLKRSVINISQLKPTLLTNLNSLNPSQQPQNPPQISISRPQSRQGRQKTQNTTVTRTDSKSKTYNGNFGFKQSPNNSLSTQSKATDGASDQQGNKLLIEQLQQIIERKQNRIKQLTKELSKNLAEQKQLQKTIQNFQNEINQIQCERKNFHIVIERLQEENLNYQLQIKELKEAEILRNQVDNLSTSTHQNSSQYKMLKQFQLRQKVLKFMVRKQIQLTIENTPILENESAQKNPNSLSRAIAFNDISQITPKRLSKKLLSSQIDQSYILQSNVITTRKNLALEGQSRQKRNDKSLSKYQMIGASRTQMKSKKQTESYIKDDMRENQRQNYHKIMFLQALTIQQMLQDI